jgi:hypothetical protein
MPVTNANVSVADARRDDTIKRFRRQIDYLERDIRQGAIGANGMRNDYLAERVEMLKGERDRLAAEIRRLNELSRDDLIAEFVPAVAEFEKATDEPGPTLRDLLTQRGEMGPQVKILSRQTLPTRREGPEAGVAAPEAAPEGWVPGTVHKPDYSAYRRR